MRVGWIGRGHVESGIFALTVIGGYLIVLDPAPGPGPDGIGLFVCRTSGREPGAGNQPTVSALARRGPRGTSAQRMAGFPSPRGEPDAPAFLPL